MTSWQRLTGDASCGRCGARLTVGMPALAISIRGVSRVLIRCADCEGPAPPDLPAVPVLAEVDASARMTPLKLAAPTLREWLPYAEEKDA